MSIATLTSKGQITLPKDIRAKLHLEAGEKIAFRIDETTGQAVLFPMNKRVDEVFGMLGNAGAKRPKSVDEMNNAVREKIKKEYE
ncbi:MAG: AbrB/MazE/SpoVT family DNA-binding domain-containing protein [Chitinivibrionales bacterium]